MKLLKNKQLNAESYSAFSIKSKNKHHLSLKYIYFCQWKMGQRWAKNARFDVSARHPLPGHHLCEPKSCLLLCPSFASVNLVASANSRGPLALGFGFAAAKHPSPWRTTLRLSEPLHLDELPAVGSTPSSQLGFSITLLDFPSNPVKHKKMGD